MKILQFFRKKDNDDSRFNPIKTPKSSPRKLKKIMRDREEASDDTDPEFISVFVEKELNIPSEESNSEDVQPTNENFSYNFYTKRAKSSSPLESPRGK